MQFARADIDKAIVSAMMTYRAGLYLIGRRDCLTFAQAYLYALTGMSKFLPGNRVCGRHVYDRTLPRDELHSIVSEVLGVSCGDWLGSNTKRPPQIGDVLVWGGGGEGTGVGIIIMPDVESANPIALTYTHDGIVRTMPPNPVAYWPPYTPRASATDPVPQPRRLGK